MRILIFAASGDISLPSLRFRWLELRSALASRQIDIEIQSFWSEKPKPTNIFLILKGLIGQIGAAIFKAPHYDMVIVHREAIPFGPPFVEWILSFRSKKLCFDFDDAVWLSSGGLIKGFLKCAWKTHLICGWSDIVFAGNSFLASFAQKFCSSTIVVPTTVDLNRYVKLPHQKQSPSVVIGWTGTSTTLIYWESLLPLLRQIAAEYDVRFLIICDVEPRVELNNLEYRRWNQSTEMQDLSCMDIGIMPLPDDEWTRGKCGFKAIQYMALGIPTIASGVGANLDIIENRKSGLLAHTSEDWLKGLGQLIQEPEMRALYGAAGYQRVRSFYSNDRAATLIADALFKI